MPEPGYLDDDSPGCIWLLLGDNCCGGHFHTFQVVSLRNIILSKNRLLAVFGSRPPPRLPLCWGCFLAVFSLDRGGVSGNP